MGTPRPLAAAAIVVALLPAGAAAADAPAWHPPYTPARAGNLAGQVPTQLLELTTAAAGRAVVVVGAPTGAVDVYGRAAAAEPWGTARAWSPGGALRPVAAGGAVLSAALGATGALQAVWTSPTGVLAGTGTAARGGVPVRVPLPAGTAASELRIAAVPAGAAYVVVVARPGGPATLLAGRIARSGAVGAPAPFVARTTPGAPGVQLGADAAGDLTAAWIGDGDTLQAAVLPAGATGWTGTAVTGAVAAPPSFALSVAPGGRALLAFQSGLAIAPAPAGSGGVPFLASASLAVAERPSAAAAFGPPATLATYSAPAPATGSAVGVPGQALAPAAAVNDGGAAVVGYAVQPSGSSAPQLFGLRRPAADAPWPAPAPVPAAGNVAGGPAGNPLFGGAVEAASAAIDPQGTAALSWTQPLPVGTGAGVVLQVATSTAAAPAWAGGVDPTAGCPPLGPSNRGTLSVAPLEAVPTGGVVVAFQCNGPAGSPAPAVPAVAAFDALGPPVSRFAPRADRVTLVLAEPAAYSLTASAPGRAGRTLSGRASAGATVSRAFTGLRPGRYTVTLVARLANGNTTRVTRTTTVS